MPDQPMPGVPSEDDDRYCAICGNRRYFPHCTCPPAHTPEEFHALVKEAIADRVALREQTATLTAALNTASRDVALMLDDVERLTKELQWARGQVDEALKFEPNWKTHTAQTAAIETLDGILRRWIVFYAGIDEVATDGLYADTVNALTADYAKKADEVEG